MSIVTGLPRRSWCSFESTNSGNLRDEIPFHHANFGYECLLIQRLALQECGLGHLKLLLGHCLLIAEHQNSSTVGSFGRDCTFELITKPGIGSLKSINTALMVADGMLRLLFAVLQGCLKIVDHFHVFLNLLP